MVAAMISGKAYARDFHAWLQDLRQEARAYGISEKLIAEALPDSLTPNARILRFDHRQPEGGISFERYKHNVITVARIRDGRRKMAQNEQLLKEVSADYGVEPQYIAALWGIETSFGRNMGGFETIPALVTLAYDGRRGTFFRQELLKALRIVDQGNIGLHEMKGSWAGAMGQCQFMPTSFEKYAQDFDKDGKRDIWDTKADVFASTAAYLAESGWKAGEPWGIPIKLAKGFDSSLIGPNIEKPYKSWQDAGVINLQKSLPFSGDEGLSVVQPGGKGYKAYLVGGNYRILLKWNTSTYFATAAGLLADALKI